MAASFAVRGGLQSFCASRRRKRWRRSHGEQTLRSLLSARGIVKSVKIEYKYGVHSILYAGECASMCEFLPCHKGVASEQGTKSVVRGLVAIIFPVSFVRIDDSI